MQQHALRMFKKALRKLSMKRLEIIFLLIILAVFMCACPEKSAANKKKTEKVRVFVSILPQKFIVEKIGGVQVEANVLVPPGKDPHTYEPSPKQLIELGCSRIYFKSGMPFENVLIEKIKGISRSLDVFDMGEGIQKATLEKHIANNKEPADNHIHEPGKCNHGGIHGDEHSHGADELDPHIWLSLPLVKKMAENTCAVLKKLKPESTVYFEDNLKLFCAEADALDRRLETALLSSKGGIFLVFHPAFGYFAERYGLRQYCVEIEGKSPTPKELEELIKTARRNNVKIVFFQPQFDSKYAESVAKAIDGSAMQLNDLAEDIFSNLKHIADILDKKHSSRKEAR